MENSIFRCNVPVNQTYAIMPAKERCHVYKNYHNSSGSISSCPNGLNFTLNERETTISSEVRTYKYIFNM